MLHRQQVVKMLVINCHITVWGLIWVRGMSPIGLWDVFMERDWVFIFFQVVQFQVVEVLNTVIIGIVFVKCPVNQVTRVIFAVRLAITITTARALHARPARTRTQARARHIQRAKHPPRAALP